LERTRLFVAGTAAALAAAVLALGGALGETPGSPPSAAASAPVEFDPAAETKARVRSLQTWLREHPRDAHSLALLGLAYQQRSRETGDPAYLSRADGVLRRSLRLAPRSVLALTGLGSLALSRHDFRLALRLGRRALALAPRDAAAYGVVGDALVELGRYDEAFRAFDTLAARKPGVAAYARVSYGRELIGDTPGAIASMELALAAAGASAEATAWTLVRLARLELGRGRLRAAGARLRAALAVFPSYPFALDSLAYVEAARGRPQRALALARRAVAGVPLPQFVGTLADVYELRGDRRRAREQYALVRAIGRLLAAAGVRDDLEVARFDVDHGLRLRRAVGIARRAHAARPSVEADDVLGWALARVGRCGEARRFSERALRLGTRDASMEFHRGMIERCLGHRAAARARFRRALALNPHFSLRWARVAREYAR
jgi:tetratricopeptide (TPR) repeat protein